MKQRPRNPILTGTVRERTGSSGILRSAVREINARFDGLRTDVLAIFNAIRVYQVNDAPGLAGADAAHVMYGLTPEELAATAQALQDALDRWIVSGREPANTLWWSTYVEESARLGTAQTAANLTNLSAAYAATRTLQEIVYSAPYRNRVAMAQVKSYEHWAGLSGNLRSELSQVIGQAVADGRNPKAVASLIAERLDVSLSKAKQYAQTDITDTLRQARMAEADYAMETLDLNLGLLWTSALIPTTRPWHASRNGQVYTSAEVREFYSVNGNRYNCHCATSECLLDTEGKPILTDSLKSTMAKEKAAWQKAQGKR